MLSRQQWSAASRDTATKHSSTPASGETSGCSVVLSVSNSFVVPGCLIALVVLNFVLWPGSTPHMAEDYGALARALTPVLFILSVSVVAAAFGVLEISILSVHGFDANKQTGRRKRSACIVIGPIVCVVAAYVQLIWRP